MLDRLWLHLVDSYNRICNLGMCLFLYISNLSYGYYARWARSSYLVCLFRDSLFHTFAHVLIDKQVFSCSRHSFIYLFNIEYSPNGKLIRRLSTNISVKHWHWTQNPPLIQLRSTARMPIRSVRCVFRYVFSQKLTLPTAKIFDALSYSKAASGILHV